MTKDEAFFRLAQIANAAFTLDLDQARKVLAANPGPEVYLAMLTATIRFAETLREIDARLGHQRAPIIAAIEQIKVSKKAGPLQ
jgi:hypothetical protein